MRHTAAVSGRGVGGMASCRYDHESTPQLYVLLSLARTRVQYGQTEEQRRRAMEDVELIRSELVRRNASPDWEAACM